jgi:hypothetical protein
MKCSFLHCFFLLILIWILNLVHNRYSCATSCAFQRCGRMIPDLGTPRFVPTRSFTSCSLWCTRMSVSVDNSRVRLLFQLVSLSQFAASDIYYWLQWRMYSRELWWLSAKGNVVVIVLPMILFTCPELHLGDHLAGSIYAA